MAIPTQSTSSQLEHLNLILQNLEKIDKKSEKLLERANAYLGNVDQVEVISKPSESPSTPLKRLENSPWYKNPKFWTGVSIISAVAIGVFALANSDEFTSWLNTPEDTPSVLEPEFLTEREISALDVRHEYPSQFATLPIATFFGSTTSSIYAAIRSAAALGELANPMMLFASRFPGCAGWCSPCVVDSKETIMSHLNTVSYEQFAKRYDNPINPLSEEQIQVKYKEYLERVGKENKETLEALEQVPEAIQKDHFARYATGTDFEKYKIQYHTVSNPKRFEESPEGFTNSERSERSVSGDVPHETRAQWSYNVYDDKLMIHRYVRDTHSVGSGTRKSKWDQFHISCKKPDNETIKCTSSQLDHVDGPLKYIVKEKMVSPTCSQITETLDFPNRKITHHYSLNPAKQMPYVLSKLIDSVKFLKYKAQTYASKHFGGTVDAKIVLPTQFPTDLPQTCE